MDFVAIDFEASCLPRHGRSFPIEVAISGSEGTRSWLIKPHPRWHDWHWAEEAARLHGLTFERLERDGLPPKTVMAELIAAIGDRRVVADSTIDAGWWAELAAVTDGPRPPCRIGHVGRFLDELGATAAEIAEAKRVADRRFRSRHRAAPDAAWLHCLLAELEGITAMRGAFRNAA